MLRQSLLATGVLMGAVSALFLLASGVRATRDASGAWPGVAATADVPKQSEAKSLYGKFCLSCHGADGKANEMKKVMPTIPDFTSREWQQGVSNPQLTVSILEGKGTLMPGLRDRLSDQQTQALVVYVREFARPPVKAEQESPSK